MALAAVVAGGCHSSATAIDITVDADPSLMLDAIAFTASAAGKTDLVHSVPAAPNPVKVTVAPSGLGEGAPVTLEVRGLKAADVVIVARGRVEVHDGRRVSIAFQLRADCAHMLACKPTETCDHGACVPIGGTAGSGDGGAVDGDAASPDGDAASPDADAAGPEGGGADRPPKKGDGMLCTVDDECQSGTCGVGRCCSTGTSCTCPQPSAQNILRNPGFEADVSGWTSDPGTTAVWASSDAENCPFSGSAYVTTPGSTTSRFWQCVAVSPSTAYNFGVRMHAQGVYNHCVLELYASAGCTNVGNMVADSLWLNVDWSGDLATIFTTAAGDRSARVSCYDDDSGAGTGGSLFVDMVYLTPAPGGY
jgi:hypothetical protein